MKKILAIAVVVVMTAALCLSASATLNIDRIHVNNNELDKTANVMNDDPIEINKGDKLYTLGWAYSETNLKKIVYQIDGGADVDCPDIYRDRPDVAAAFGLDESLGSHAGFGTNDTSADENGNPKPGMLNLPGIEALDAGEYKLTIKAIYQDDTSESKDFNLKIVAGGAQAEEPAAEKDPDTWLCKAGGSVATGWWMNPFTEQDWDISFTFETPNAFNGFISTLFASAAGSTVKINVLDASGNVVDTVEHTQKGDGLVTITFNKTFAAGKYTIQFVNTNSGEYFVVASSEAGDIPVEVSGNGATNENTLAAPVILLTGAAAPKTGSDDTPATNPTTADASVIAIAAVAVVALAGVAVAKKVR
ncbi:MAG: hypothetical protein IJT49_10335 [Clostridia bacterium]|nr:hypothetical protein [Clostridia bacterium]